MKSMSCIFGDTERAKLWQIKIHFGGSFGAWGQLENKLDPIYGAVHDRSGDDVGWRNQSLGSLGKRLSESRAELSFGTLFKQDAVHVLCPAAHGVACINVLANGVFKKSFGHDDFRLAGFYIRFRNNASYSAVVIDVTMSMNHGNDRPLWSVLVIKVEGGSGSFCGE